MKPKSAVTQKDVTITHIQGSKDGNVIVVTDASAGPAPLPQFEKLAPVQIQGGKPCQGECKTSDFARRTADSIPNSALGQFGKELKCAAGGSVTVVGRGVAGVAAIDIARRFASLKCATTLLLLDTAKSVNPAYNTYLVGNLKDVVSFNVVGGAGELPNKATQAGKELISAGRTYFFNSAADFANPSIWKNTKAIQCADPAAALTKKMPGCGSGTHKGPIEKQVPATKGLVPPVLGIARMPEDRHSAPM